MHGTVAMKTLRKVKLETILLTPEMATEILEHNKINRPLNEQHVKRIARQITDGKWRFNGDTIKVSDTDDVIDGQHRLWAVLESKTPIETIIVRGVEKEAFSTIDTLRKPRNGSDVLALMGVSRYRPVTASALQWLLRWQRKVLMDYRAPQNRIENSDVEMALADNPGILPAIERAMNVRRIGNPSILACFYYVLVNRNADLAERMFNTLENPAGVSVNDPFFMLRNYFTSDHHRTKDPLMTFALMVKACNAAHSGARIRALSWKKQGKAAEEFPALKV